MSAVCIIPARGGSRRIPRKNIRPFHGKPIIAYSIEAALRSQCFADVFVSTEDDEIADVALRYGAAILERTPEESDDSVGTQTVMRRHLTGIQPTAGRYHWACCLYPCAPMLSHTTLQAAVQYGYREYSANYVVPMATWMRDPGQFYFGKAHAFSQEHPLVSIWTRILPIDPRTDCDINTEDDWARAEKMYADLKANP